MVLFARCVNVKFHIYFRMRRIEDEPKPLIWRATSKADFSAFPRPAQREMGYALFLAQMDSRHRTIAKTLKGFGNAAVVEVRESYQGNAYRAVYTVRYPEAIMGFTPSRRNRPRASAPPSGN